jgi:uncharacterized membrane protein
LEKVTLSTRHSLRNNLSLLIVAIVIAVCITYNTKTFWGALVCLAMIAIGWILLEKYFQQIWISWKEFYKENS